MELDPEKQQRGTLLVKEGILAHMRRNMGVSLNQFAGFLKSHGSHVRRWETGDVQWVHWNTAQRVADFCDAYAAAETWLKDENLTWAQIIPLRGAASHLGVAVTVLRMRLAAQDVEPIELGLLGDWVTREEMSRCRR